MSLMKLLTLGHAWNAMRDVSPYQLGKQNALPTFGASVSAQISPVTTPVKPGWLKRNNPFADAPATAPAAGTQQVELSLDKVKVVRNDLADADIEIIPKAPPGTTMPAKRYVRSGAQPDELGKKAWGMLGTRLFGAAAKH